MQTQPEVARLDEMSEGRLSLRILQADDGDIIVSIDCEGMPITDDNGIKARVEFCSTAGGGGASPKTREALLALKRAMLEDNAADPRGIPPYPMYLADRLRKAAGASLASSADMSQPDA